MELKKAECWATQWACYSADWMAVRWAEKSAASWADQRAELSAVAKAVLWAVEWVVWMAGT